QALITGLLFARFARPTAAIKFSRNMLVAPYRGGQALMFRIVNLRSNELVDMNARVNCSWMEDTPDGPVRHYKLLSLERSDVMFFPLAWTLVHPLNEASPLQGLTEEILRERDYQFLVIVS